MNQSQRQNQNTNPNNRLDNDQYQSFLSWIKDNNVMLLIHDCEPSDILDTLYFCWLGGYMAGHKSGSYDLAKSIYSLQVLKDNDE